MTHDGRLVVEWVVKIHVHNMKPSSHPHLPVTVLGLATKSHVCVFFSFLGACFWVQARRGDFQHIYDLRLKKIARLANLATKRSWLCYTKLPSAVGIVFATVCFSLFPVVCFVVLRYSRDMSTINFLTDKRVNILDHKHLCAK